MSSHFTVDTPMHRVVPCRHGVMLVLKGDTTIGRALDLYGEFAESENRLMLQFVRRGGWAVDIGANVGTVTLPLARAVGPEGRVLAFEPQRLVFQTLCANLAVNGFANVEAHAVAIGDASGTISVPALDPLAPANFGAVRVTSVVISDSDTVPVVALDSFSLSRCELIKIDVEGMEQSVLSGAAKTVERLRPVVYFEAKKHAGTQACLTWLFERGYRLWWHFARFFSPENYRANSNNVFGNTGDINAIAVPAERDLDLDLPGIASPESDWQRDYQTWRAKRGAVS